MAGWVNLEIRSFEKIDVEMYQFLFCQHNNSHSRICNTRRWSPRRLPKPGSCETFYYTIFERPRTRYVWYGDCSLSSIRLQRCGGLRCARRAQCEIFRPSFSLPGTAYRRRRLMADWKQGTDLLFSTRTVVLPIFRVQRCVPFSPSSFRCSCSRRRRPSPQNSVVRSSAAPGEP